MESKKTDLVIKYNLHWKNAPNSNAKNRVNIVGMCDFPASTHNLEKFKSYLLKNSGATGDDVRVWYIGDEDKEFPIETQEDFQTALNYFREVARSGNTITLKLDRIFYKNNKPGQFKRSISSSEENSSMEKDEEVFVAEEQAQSHINEAPQWFTQYMSEFKKEIVKEVAAAVVKSISDINAEKSRPPAISERNAQVEIKKKPKEKPAVAETAALEPGSLSKKKTKINKRILKASGDNIAVEKDALKERKLDLKLAKLENRTMKIKEKKAALQMKHTVDSNRLMDIAASEIENLMGAIPVGQHETTIPHMTGGEIFEQEWEVVNTGQLPWTSETELHYAWGSEALKPVRTTYSCPYLKPGEKGIVKVQLEVPRKAGTYESYWHFHHVGRRFGHWLGCQVIVDPSPVKNTSEKRSGVNMSEVLPPVNFAAHSRKLFQTLQEEAAKMSSFASNVENNEAPLNLSKDKETKTLNINLDLQEKENLQKDIQDLSENLEDLKIDRNEDVGSDTDNRSIVSIAESNLSSSSESADEFVLVAIPKEEEDSANTDNNASSLQKDANENLEGNESDKNNNSKIGDVEATVNLSGSNSSDSDFEDYIKINGKKILLPTVNFPYEKLQKSEETKQAEQSFENKKENEKEINKSPSEIKQEQPEASKEEDKWIEKTENPSEKTIEDDQNMENMSKDTNEFAFVEINGEKVAVPKKFLRPDFLAKTESEVQVQPSSSPDTNEHAKSTTAADETVKQDVKNAEPPAQKIETITTPRPETSTSASTYEFVPEPLIYEGIPVGNVRNTQSIYMSAATTPDISLCSLQDASSSDDVKSVPLYYKTNYPNNTRLFVFPQNCPGFEVLYSPHGNEESFVSYNNNSQTNTSQADSNYKNPWFSHYSTTNSTTGNNSSFFQNTANNHQFSYSCSVPNSTYMNCGYEHYTYPNVNQQQQQQQQQQQEQHVNQPIFHHQFCLPNGVNGQWYNLNASGEEMERARAAAEQVRAEAAEHARAASAEAERARAAAEQVRAQAAEQARAASAEAEYARAAAEQVRAQATEQARAAAAEAAKLFTFTNEINASNCGFDRVHAGEQRSAGNFYMPINTPPSCPNSPPSGRMSRGEQARSIGEYFLPNESTASNLSSSGSERGEKTASNSRNNSFKGMLPVPENIVSGAVNVASSAINTARSVLNMFNPEPGTWINGHWVPNNLESKRERALRILYEMGFCDRDLNATLLARYNDDIARVISELVQ